MIQFWETLDAAIEMKSVADVSLPLRRMGHCPCGRSFVNDVRTDTKCASITRMLVALGLDLNLAVIAEGVETESQRKLLERQGCMLYQGYPFGPALTLAQFEAFAAESSHRDVRESISD